MRRVAPPSSQRLGLHPFPTGWYCVGFDHELRKPQRGVWCGRELGISRAPDGGYRVTAGDGRPCHTVTQQQALFLWHHEDGGAPAWHLPVPDEVGWTRYGTHCWRGLATHPQETTENSVDTAHFSVVHGYAGVETLSEARVEGPRLHAAYAITRRLMTWGPFRGTFRARFAVDVHGLGYSRVQNHVEGVGLSARHMVYATPRDGHKMDLRIAWAVRRPRLGPLSAPVATILSYSVRAGFLSDVTADLDIWQNKRFVARPPVLPADGPIRRYRTWARQFYPVSPPRLLSVVPG